MKKIATLAVSTVFLFAACGGESDAPKVSDADKAAAEFAWSVVFDEEARGHICDAAEIAGDKETLIAAFTEGEDTMSEGEAEAFYAILQEDC